MFRTVSIGLKPVFIQLPIQRVQCFCGNSIWSHNEVGLENLAYYIIRASFSQERMTYIPDDESADGVAKVIYDSKDGKTTKTFDALDWPAQLTTHNGSLKIASFSDS